MWLFWKENLTSKSMLLFLHFLGAIYNIDCQVYFNIDFPSWFLLKIPITLFDIFHETSYFSAYVCVCVSCQWGQQEKLNSFILTDLVFIYLYFESTGYNKLSLVTTKLEHLHSHHGEDDVGVQEHRVWHQTKLYPNPGLCELCHMLYPIKPWFSQLHSEDVLES